jgi:hypothetical protein
MGRAAIMVALADVGMTVCLTPARRLHSVQTWDQISE